MAEGGQSAMEPSAAAPPSDAAPPADAAPSIAPEAGGSQMGAGGQDASIGFVTKTYANYVQDIQQAAEGREVWFL